MKTRTNEPLVSVVVPVYNGSQFLGRAIESILSQIYGRLEIIVVDDGSNDDTARIVRYYSRSCPKLIKGIFLKHNIGESAAANIGFRASHGEFIARMDADDISYPERIQKQVEFMLREKNVVVLGTQADVINEEGRIIGKKTFPLKHRDIYWFYGICHPMLHPSCMFRRSLLPRKNKLWDATHEPNDDYITLFRLLNYGKFANLPQSLMGYRLHGSNKSLQNAKSKVFNSLRIRFDAVRYLGFKPSALAVLINFLQFIGVLILPERYIVPVYLFLRGMVGIKQPLRNPLLIHKSLSFAVRILNTNQN